MTYQALGRRRSVLFHDSVCPYDCVDLIVTDTIAKTISAMTMKASPACMLGTATAPVVTVPTVVPSCRLASVAMRLTLAMAKELVLHCWKMLGTPATNSSATTLQSVLMLATAT